VCAHSMVLARPAQFPCLARASVLSCLVRTGGVLVNVIMMHGTLRYNRQSPRILETDLEPMCILWHLRSQSLSHVSTLPAVAVTARTPQSCVCKLLSRQTCTTLHVHMYITMTRKSTAKGAITATIMATGQPPRPAAAAPTAAEPVPAHIQGTCCHLVCAAQSHAQLDVSLATLHAHIQGTCRCLACVETSTEVTVHVNHNLSPPQAQQAGLGSRHNGAVKCQQAQSGQSCILLMHMYRAHTR
jgi:hypothetical protein